jgi:hypothetical protein
MIKLFTMVKDECDIIRDWIVYHGFLFGYENLFIIDNMSSDGTYEIINEFLEKGIHIYRESDYKEKGNFMRRLINAHCYGSDVAFPIDIDEFIVYYECGMKNVNCNKDIINNYINDLGNYINGLGDVASIYKANYILSMITQEGGYGRAACENKWGIYSDYGSNAKSFFRVDLYNGPIDHGNHIGSGNEYFVSNICLAHFHSRNLEQMKKKVLNNIIGLGYPNDLNSLREVIRVNPNCQGNHHVKHQINILEGVYRLDSWIPEKHFIDLSELNNYLSKIN